MLGLGYVIPLIYFLWSLKYGPKPEIIPGTPRGWNGKLLRRRPPIISNRLPL